jgi:predicted ATPase
MSTSFPLKKFTILGFQEKANVEIPFQENTKILIGENGVGKTQILNILYYTLSRKFERLINFNFQKVILDFIDGDLIEISKEEIESSLFNTESPMVQQILNYIGPENFLNLRDLVTSRTIGRMDFSRNKIVQDVSNIIPPDVFYDILRRGFAHRVSSSSPDLFSSRINELNKTILSKLGSNQILYFPTYRRIEEDLKNLGYDEEQLRIKADDNRLINFGMGDVQRRFEIITGSIDKISKEGFAKLSSEILSQLVRGFPMVDRRFIDEINENDIQIILERIGGQLSDDDKQKIKDIIARKELEKKDNLLLYFLQKLVEVYNQQREFDTTIKEYVRVCNTYLTEKKVVYDESSMTIYVKPDDSENKLLLSKLSSGEKQIISILSKIYLTTQEVQYIVLFDEPELSLSIFWQRQLLPDIVKSKKCSFLLAVTHSPFIFENELDKHAITLKEYFYKIDR